MNKIEAEGIIKALAGGSTPGTYSILKFTEKGWRFTKDHWRGVVSSDPSDAEEGDFWFNTGDSTLRVETSGGTYKSAVFTLA